MAMLGIVKQNRLAFLDSLRGLAAVYVVLFHVLSMPAPVLSAGSWLTPAISMGGSGVGLFFVISAFSLFYTMPRHQASGMPLRSFYIHRFFRIAPLFFVLLAFSIWRDGRGQHVGHSAGEMFANATFTFNLFDGWQQGIVWASWAIGVEMLFYAVFPFLFKLIGNTLAALLVCVVSLGIAWAMKSGMAGQSGLHTVESYGLLRHAPIFAFGILAYFLYAPVQRWNARPKNRVGMALLALSVAILVGTGTVAYRGYLAELTIWIFMGAGYVATLLALSMTPVKLVVNRATRFLGTISYSIYLGHPIVVAALITTLRRIQVTLGDGAISYLACAALTLAIVLPSPFFHSSPLNPLASNWASGWWTA
jgi:peptidoglycan/LPS O-acetylase OafA/YrhL